MRKEIDVTITDGGSVEVNRDFGKTFHLTEMPAMVAEKWATKALFALAQSGVDINPGLLNAGMNGLAVIGIQALLNVKFEAAEPLLDQMMACVKIKEPSITRALTPDDIEEVKTFFTLRGEVLKLHLGFFTAGDPSK